MGLNSALALRVGKNPTQVGLGMKELALPRLGGIAIVNSYETITISKYLDVNSENCIWVSSKKEKKKTKEKLKCSFAYLIIGLSIECSLHNSITMLGLRLNKTI